MFSYGHKQKRNDSKLDKHHHGLLKENMKAAPDVSHFFLTLVKMIGHIIEATKNTPLKSRIVAILKLQPPSDKKKNPELLVLIFLR